MAQSSGGGFNFNITSRDEYSAMLSRLQSELRALQTQFAGLNNIAQQWGTGQSSALKTVQAEIETTKSRIDTLTASYGHLAVAAEKAGAAQQQAANDRLYDLQRRLDIATQVDPGTSRADRTYDLQRQLDIAFQMRPDRNTATLVGAAASNAGEIERLATTKLINSALHEETKTLQEVITGLTGAGAASSTLALRQQLVHQAIAASNSAAVQQVLVAKSLAAAAANAAPARNRALDSIFSDTPRLTASQIEELTQKLGGAKKEVEAVAEAGITGFTNWGRTLQHITAIFDGSMRGQRGQVIASTTALLRDSGIMQTALSALAGSWAVIGTAGIAAMVGIGYAAEQTYQRFRSIRDTASELAIKGFGNQTGNATAEFDSIKSATNEYAGTVRALQTELNKLPPAVQSSRQEFAQMAIALGALRHEDPAKAIEAAVKAAIQGKDAFAKWTETTFGLEHQLTGTGESLAEVVKHSNNLEEAFRLLATTGASLPIVKIGTESAVAGNSLASLNLQVAALGEGATADSPIVSQLVDAIEKSINPLKGATNATYNLTGAIAAQNAVIINANSALDKRIGLLREMASAEAGVERLGTGGAAGEYGTGQDAPRRARSAAANTQAEVGRSALSPAEEEEHKIRMDNIRAEAEARRADLTTQASAADARLAEEKRIATLRFTGPGIDPTRSAALAAETSGVKAAETAALEAHRRVEDQKTTLTIDAIKARMAEEKRSSALRIADQLQIIEITKREVEAGRKSLQELAQEEIKLGTIKRQVNAGGAGEAKKTYDANISDIKNQITAERGHLEAQQGLFKQWEAAARSTFPEGSAQLQKALAEMTRASHTAFREMINDMTEHARALHSIATSEIREFEADMQARVKLRGQGGFAPMTSQQALGFDIQEIGRQLALIKETFQSELDAIPDKSSEIFQKAADAQNRAVRQMSAQLVEFQEKWIAEGAKIADRWAAPFKKAFEGVGSAFETAISDVLTRTSTTAQAAQKIGQSIAKGLIDSIGSTLSKVIAQSIDKTVTGGIGDLFSKWITKAVGGIVGDTAGAAANTAAIAAAAPALTTGVAAAGPALTAAIVAAGPALTAAVAAGSAGGSAGGAVSGVLSLAELFGFEKGGVVSAAGGMIAGGGLSLLHPREMVLPAHLSIGLQNMIDRGQGGSSNSTTLNYNANVTGYHPFESRTAFRSALDSQFAQMSRFVGHAARSGFRA